MFPWPRFSISFLFVAAIAACGSSATRDQARDASPKWRIVRDLRIGSIDAPDYTLTEIIALTVGPDGAMYVAQWNEPAVHVFDQEGRFAFAIGRRGGGPGEFSQPAGLGWIADTLWVLDMPIGRLSLFEGNGAFLSSFSLVAPPISKYYSGLAPVTLLADGSVLSLPSVPAHLVSGGVVDSIPLFRSDRSLEFLDTLAWLSMEHTQLEIEYPGGRFFTRQPISDAQLYDAYPDGQGLIVVERSIPSEGEPRAFRVLRLGVGGDTVFLKSIPFEPVPLSQQYADSVVGDMVSGLGDRIAGPVEDLLREALFLPAIHSPVKSLVAGRDETIWLEVASARTDSAVWNVLDPSGELIGVVTAPIGLRLFQAQRDLLWGVERGALDVNYIVRFRVIEAQEDAA